MSDRVGEIRARLAAATPGPWVFGKHDCIAAPEVEAAGEFTVCVVTSRTDGWMPSGQKEADGALIANAPADLEWLIGEVDRLTAQREQDAIYLKTRDATAEARGFARARAAAAQKAERIFAHSGSEDPEDNDAREIGREIARAIRALVPP